MIDKDQQIKDLQAMLKAEQEKNGNLPSLQDKVNQLTRENADLRNKLNDLNREYREQSKALVTAVKIARHIQLYTPAE